MALLPKLLLYVSASIVITTVPIACAVGAFFLVGGSDLSSVSFAQVKQSLRVAYHASFSQVKDSMQRVVTTGQLFEEDSDEYRINMGRPPKHRELSFAETCRDEDAMRAYGKEITTLGIQMDAKFALGGLEKEQEDYSMPR